MLIAQTVVTTTLAAPAINETQTSWIAITIAATAIIVSAVVGGYAIMQGRVIKNIETREHEWEKKDRISAHIQVTREFYQKAVSRTLVSGPAASFANIWYIRLTNTGRTTATNIGWTADYVGFDEGAAEGALMEGIVKGPTLSLDELHPGEHFDLYLNRRSSVHASRETINFIVSWADQRGNHETTRLMNWN